MHVAPSSLALAALASESRTPYTLVLHETSLVDSVMSDGPEMSPVSFSETEVRSGPVKFVHSHSPSRCEMDIVVDRSD